MAARKSLVAEHLENVSGETLEAYPQIIREMIRGRHGIYALYRGTKLYYVGLANNLMGRLKAHLRDRHAGHWDRFSVYLTADAAHMKELESLVLRIFNPKGNAVGGNFRGSHGLRRDLNRMLREADADRRASLMGGRVKEVRRRQKIRKGLASGNLAGVVSRSTKLLGWRNGWEYEARLLKDGSIRYYGEDYWSPTAAARAALERPVSGWRFWRFEQKPGEWRPLLELKR